MKNTLLAALSWIGVSCAAAQAEGTPKIQFEQTVCDFGKTSLVESVSGVFKFKNAGDGLLKLEPPKPSCGCTIAGLKPDTLKPGERGELSFTLHLGRYRATMEKHISVKSNDPVTPEVALSIKADYTPLYDVAPMALAPNLPLGIDATNQVTTITRTDGKPLRILKLEPSKPWISAKVEPGAKTNDTTAQVRVELRRGGPPGRFNEFVQVYSADQTNGPVSTIFLFGQIMGELSVSPEALYWSVTDPEKIKTEHPETMVTRRVTIRSANGKEFELKNPKSTLQGVHVQLVPKERGKVYELVAKLDDVPDMTTSGQVSFETSVAAQPRIEMPITVSVLRP